MWSGRLIPTALYSARYCTFCARMDHVIDRWWDCSFWGLFSRLRMSPKIYAGVFCYIGVELFFAITSSFWRDSAALESPNIRRRVAIGVALFCRQCFILTGLLAWGTIQYRWDTPFRLTRHMCIVYKASPSGCGWLDIQADGGCNWKKRREKKVATR